MRKTLYLNDLASPTSATSLQNIANNRLTGKIFQNKDLASRRP
jgi:hypothetical protein